MRGYALQNSDIHSKNTYYILQIHPTYTFMQNHLIIISFTLRI